MSRWWRAYDEALHDPKLLALSDKLHRAWFSLLCVASKNGGILPAIGTVAIELRVTTQKAAEYITALVTAGLIDEIEAGKFAPHNWGGRQFQSDGSTDRVKRFRQRKRNVSSAVSVTPPDTDTDTDTDRSEPNGSAADAAVEIVGEEPRAKLFRIGKPLLASWGVSPKQQGSLLGMWLKAKNDPEGLLAAIQFARDHNVAEPVSYISAAVNSKARQDGQRRQTLADLAFELADEVADAERAAGIGRPDAAVRSG